MRKMKKLKKPSARTRDFSFFSANFCFFTHISKGNHRVMYLSFILATFCNGKQQQFYHQSKLNQNYE